MRKTKATQINVAVLFGGQSPEHQVSLMSATNVLEQLSKEKYKIFPIGIHTDGSFTYFSQKPILHESNPKKIKLSSFGERVSFSFGSQRRFYVLSQKKYGSKIDVLFPVLHGRNGEDGSIQGLAQIMGIPCVGATIIGSSVGMDKDVSKRLLRDAHIPVADFLVFDKSHFSKIRFEQIAKRLGLPFFVKPATGGSSVGVHKIETKNDFRKKIEDAFFYSNKILFEETINGREIESSILGNRELKISLPGAITSHHDFYSYEAKYIDPNGASFEIPVKLSKKIVKHIQQVSLNAYKTLSCSGMARVDGFLKNDGSFIINEINTIPGFTSISMYPKLWEVSGISYPELLDQLIKLALENAT